MSMLHFSEGGKKEKTEFEMKSQFTFEAHGNVCN